MKIELPLQDNEYTISSGYKTAFVAVIKSPIIFVKYPKYIDRKHRFSNYSKRRK